MISVPLDKNTLKKYLEDAGVPPDAAGLIASLKAKYLSGGNVSDKEEKDGSEIVKNYVEQVALAKKNLQNDGYTLERL